MKHGVCALIPLVFFLHHGFLLLLYFATRVPRDNRFHPAAFIETMFCVAGPLRVELSTKRYCLKSTKLLVIDTLELFGASGRYIEIHCALGSLRAVIGLSTSPGSLHQHILDCSQTIFLFVNLWEACLLRGISGGDTPSLCDYLPLDMDVSVLGPRWAPHGIYIECAGFLWGRHQERRGQSVDLLLFSLRSGHGNKMIIRRMISSHAVYGGLREVEQSD